MGSYTRLMQGISYKIAWTLIVLMVAGILMQVSDLQMAQAATDSPASVRLDVPLYGEQYNLSCEYAVAHMITAFWGMELSEGRFIANIDPNPNPHKGFRGKIDGVFGGIDNYGIYAEPIAAYLQIKGFKTKLLVGGEAALRHELALGRPQMVWLTYALHNSYPQKAEIEGLPVTLVPWEHAGVVTGYDAGGVYINGPAEPSRVYVDWATFRRVWGYFGDMALSMWPANQPARADETLGASPLFYRVFLNHGDLETFGLPVTGELQENGKIVQYFEQARLEYDPKTQDVTFGLLGREASQSRLSEDPFLPHQPLNSSDTQYFKETSHNLTHAFLSYWQNHEGLQVFGLPISEEFVENGKTVQYFERVRLEYNSADKSVSIGTLGRELLVSPLARTLKLAIQTLGIYFKAASK